MPKLAFKANFFNTQLVQLAPDDNHKLCGGWQIPIGKRPMSVQSSLFAAPKCDLHHTRGAGLQCMGFAIALHLYIAS